MRGHPDDYPPIVDRRPPVEPAREDGDILAGVLAVYVVGFACGLLLGFLL